MIVVALVLVVQQVEGNLLHPLVMGRAVHLHPVVTLVAVTCGTLLLGIPGAILAVPLVAVTYRVEEYLRINRRPPSARPDPPAPTAPPCRETTPDGDDPPDASHRPGSSTPRRSPGAIIHPHAGETRP